MGTTRTRHPHNKLTPAAVKKLGPGMYADGGGLYLVVDDSGARRWALRTTVHGKRREIGLGPISLTPLSEAREKARQLRRVAREGGDPVAERDRERRRSLTFEEAARTVHTEQIVPTAKNGKHVRQWLATLEKYAFPTIGAKPIHAVDQADVLSILAPIWTETPETAKRVRQRLRTVLDWARTAGHREGVNPVEGVERGLPKQRARVLHHEALPWQQLPALMPRLVTASGMGALALRFAILTAARSGEVRGMRWREIDADDAVWTVPATRIKAGREHRVPLVPAALALLGDPGEPDELVFPSDVKAGRMLSDMSLTAVLKRMGHGALTQHGFRSTFRDWAGETTGHPREVIEHALAHRLKDKAEAAYARGDLFHKRRKLMQDWADFLAKPEATVTALPDTTERHRVPAS